MNAAAATPRRNFTVTLKAMQWGQERVDTMIVYARTTSEAIKLARKECRDGGYDPKHDEPIRFSARLATEGEVAAERF